jgi:branched-chain amino acid aminotransferase
MDVRNTDADLIWQDGEFVDWKNAKTHVLSHALHYGTGIFEGARLYETKDGAAVFRLDRHLERLYQSAAIHEMEIPFSKDELHEATIELLERQQLTDAYIRPVVYRGYDEIGLNPTGCEVRVAIAAVPNVQYLSEGGIDAKVSSWRRFNSNNAPTQAKTSGMYVNSALANQEVVKSGYDEAIFLNQNGCVSEGPGENLFVVQNKQLYTCGPAESVLDGITKDSVIDLARMNGYTVHDRASIDRSELYTADELFFTGTAAEIAPIRSVDDRIVTEKPPGTTSERIKQLFEESIHSQTPGNWFEQIDV